MRTPSPPYCGLDLAPPLADRFVLGVAPIDYGPVLLRIPFGFRLATDTLSSEARRAVASGPSCVFPAFHQRNGVGTQIDVAFAAQWLAYAIPYRRFAYALAVADARLGADVVCYSFIVVDLHHLLLAGLPAHSALHPERR